MAIIKNIKQYKHIVVMLAKLDDNSIRKIAPRALSLWHFSRSNSSAPPACRPKVRHASYKEEPASPHEAHSGVKSREAILSEQHHNDLLRLLLFHLLHRDLIL
jgi:hypothetical protein